MPIRKNPIDRDPKSGVSPFAWPTYRPECSVVSHEYDAVSADRNRVCEWRIHEEAHDENWLSRGNTRLDIVIVMSSKHLDMSLSPFVDICLWLTSCANIGFPSKTRRFKRTLHVEDMVFSGLTVLPSRLNVLSKFSYFWWNSVFLPKDNVPLFTGWHIS